VQVNERDDVCFRQPKTIEERIHLAKYVAQTFPVGCPVLVDTISNESITKYASWPERLYVLHKGKVLYMSGPGPFFYDLGELDAFLATL
jgi:hypothetical protein